MILYTKFSNDRRPELRILTEILTGSEDGEKTVRKKAADPPAFSHIRHIAEAGRALEAFLAGSRFKVNHFTEREDALYFDFLEGETLEEAADRLLDEPDKAVSFLTGFCAELRGTADTVFETTGAFRDVFGDEAFPEGTMAMSVADIDMILSNIIDKDGWNIIDYEWTFFFPVPADYIVWRSLNHYVDLTPKRREAFKDRDIWGLCGIAQSSRRQFLRMEESFQKYVDGGYVALRFLYDLIPTDNVEARPPYFSGLTDSLKAENAGLKTELEALRKANEELKESSRYTKDRLRKTIETISKQRSDLAAADAGKSGHFVQRLLRTDNEKDKAALIRPLLTDKESGVYDSIDTVSYREKAVVVRGWAYDTVNRLEAPVTVKADGRPVSFQVRRFARHDVIEALGIDPADKPGFVIEVPSDGSRFNSISIEFENENGYTAETIPVLKDPEERRRWNEAHADPVDVSETAGYNDWLNGQRSAREAETGPLKTMSYEPLIGLCLYGAEDYDRAEEDLKKALQDQAYANYVICRGETVGDLRKAGAEYLMPVRAGDTLERGSLREFASFLNASPEAGLVYSDEDRIMSDGSGYERPVFKPDFDPVLLCSGNYIGNGLLVKKSLAEAAPADDSCPVEDCLYGLVLEWTEKTASIGHIPKVLYHAAHRDTEPDVKDRFLKPVYRFTGKPLVSIIIPNRDMTGSLRKCLTAIENRSTYRHFEVIIAENSSVTEEVFSDYCEYEDKLKNVRTVTYKGPFNYAAINNYAAGEALGDYLIFLNNDTEIITPQWIEELLGCCMRPDTGLCGAKLYFRDGRLQHAGIAIGSDGEPVFIGQTAEGNDEGYLGSFVRSHATGAVSGACMMISKKLFCEVGGFDENLTIAYNDIDLAMKVRKTGKRVVYSAQCELIHDLGLSVGAFLRKDNAEYEAVVLREAGYFRDKWKTEIEAGDACLNRNLVYRAGRFVINE